MACRRRVRSLTAKGAIGALCAALLLSDCTAHTKREWLTFFFDGVPPERTESPTAAASPRQPGPPGTSAGLPPSPAAKAAPGETVHRPYQNRRCDACHESKFSQKLRGPAGEICLLCHQIIFEKAAVRHAPAGDGSCLACHNPHASPEKFLLTRKGQAVCRECHDERDVAGSAAHVAIGSTPCQECHDPHGGGNRLFLKTGESPASVGPDSPAGR